MNILTHNSLTLIYCLYGLTAGCESFSVSKGRYPISPFKYRREIGLVLKAAAGNYETNRVVRIFKHAFGFSKSGKAMDLLFDKY